MKHYDVNQTDKAIRDINKEIRELLNSGANVEVRIIGTTKKLGLTQELLNKVVNIENLTNEEGVVK